MASAKDFRSSTQSRHPLAPQFVSPKAHYTPLGEVSPRPPARRFTRAFPIRGRDRAFKRSPLGFFDLLGPGLAVHGLFFNTQLRLTPRSRARNLIERFFNKIKHYRAVATRYDKRADNFLAGVKLASIRIWMRFNESMT